MKILLVNYEYPTTDPNCGGGGEVTRQLKHGLEELGHVVRVVTDGVRECCDLLLFGPAEGGHWATFPVRARSHIEECVGWADVVNGHFSLPSSLGLPHLCERADTPLAISVMGADVYDPTRFTAIRPVADLVNGRLLSGADAVVAPSTDMCERVSKRYDIKTQLIHYGIDVDEWEWQSRERHNPLRVLSVSRLVERKNLSTSIKAVRELRRSGIEAEYRIVGQGPREMALKRGSKMPDWLDFRGYVDHLQAEYEWADVFFLPSKHEAFGIVFLEALANGLPVVTSQNGGQRDIVSADVGFAGRAVADGGALAVANEQYADMLAKVAVEYERYQRATRGYVKSHFSQAKMVDQYETLFQRLQT